jgi:hypothetical protein
MNTQLKTRIRVGWKTFSYYAFHPNWYVYIPMGLFYMFLGSNMQDKLWYDGWWSLWGLIVFIAGFSMWFLCFGIHAIIFIVDKIDAYIHDIVEEEINKRRMT